jgi:Uma2 family endonuclease
MVALRQLATATPPLETGDQLTLEEFERRYEAHPEIKKAELIDGVVFVASPVSSQHGEPHLDLATWLGFYRASHPGIRAGDNTSMRRRPRSMVQPDLYLRRIEGTATLSEEGYLESGPELVAEISNTTASYDLHSKMEVYRRAGVQEYIVWRVYDRAIDWFELKDGRYERLYPDESGVIESHVFPGLRLDVEKMLAGDLAAVLAEQQREPAE